MSVDRPNFMKAYDAVEVPAPIFFKRTQETQVNVISGAFFDAIQSSLDLGSHSLDTFFEMEIQGVEPLDFALPDPDHEAQELIHSFRRKGGQTLAAVLYTQGDAHYKIAHFTKYPIHPDMETEIHVMQNVERTVDGLQ